MATKLTDINITTSVARYFAENFVDAGYAIYWQATNIMSGTATNGEITLVPEFPNEPNLLSSVGPRSSDVVVIPAFSVSLIDEPTEQLRAGLGDEEFEQIGRVGIEGFVNTQAQHLAFATFFRDWFRADYVLPIYDYDLNPTAPPLLDTEVLMNNRTIDRIEFGVEDIPAHLRYYLSLEFDILFYD